MLNQRWWRAIGVGVPVITGLLLLGFTKTFDIEVSTNLFNTGITSGLVLGIANIAVAVAIYKNRI